VIRVAEARAWAQEEKGETASRRTAFFALRSGGAVGGWEGNARVWGPSNHFTFCILFLSSLMNSPIPFPGPPPLLPHW